MTASHSSCSIHSGAARWSPTEEIVHLAQKGIAIQQCDGTRSGRDLLEVEFGGTRPVGSRFWMEIDNVIFYK